MNIYPSPFSITLPLAIEHVPLSTVRSSLSISGVKLRDLCSDLSVAALVLPWQTYDLSWECLLGVVRLRCARIRSLFCCRRFDFNKRYLWASNRSLRAVVHRSLSVEKTHLAISRRGSHNATENSDITRARVDSLLPGWRHLRLRLRRFLQGIRHIRAVGQADHCMSRMSTIHVEEKEDRRGRRG